MSPRFYCAGATCVVLMALVGGCTASAGIGAGGDLQPPQGCSTDSTVQCAQGDGWTCEAGDNPQNEVANVSCSDPTPDGSNDDLLLRVAQRESPIRQGSSYPFRGASRALHVGRSPPCRRGHG